MKIVKKTPRQIVLRFIPIWNWLAGLICLIVSLFFLGISSLSGRFICDRSAPNRGTCKLIASFPLLGSIEKQLNLADLKKAEVQSIKANSKKTEYSVVLLSQQDEIVLYGNFGHFSANRKQKEEIASKINTFLKNQADLSIVIEEKEKTPFLLLAVYTLHLGLGLWIVISHQMNILTFDKNKGYVKLLQVGLLGTKTEQYNLSEIVGVQVEELETQKGVYQATLILTEGSRIYLTFPHAIKASHQKIAEPLQNFLNLPGD